MLGALPDDRSGMHSPIFTAEAGIDISKVIIQACCLPLQEPLLEEGKVAAVAGLASPANEAWVARNLAVDAEYEAKRLSISVNDNVLTCWVRANGMGNVHSARVA